MPNEKVRHWMIAQSHTHMQQLEDEEHDDESLNS
jgi:hypothetical protein